LGHNFPQFAECTFSKADSEIMTAVFNSDQGAQFTSATFTNVLERKKIVVRMDGRGRAWAGV
jgi:transposase InsO family protein